MEQLMSTSDRPLVEPLANDIHLFDDIVMLHVAFKSRPLRDGGANHHQADWPRHAEHHPA